MLAFAAIHEDATAMANPLLLPLLNWARKLRYPTLFKLTAALFAFSVLLPPGVDPAEFIAYVSDLCQAAIDREAVHAALDRGEDVTGIDPDEWQEALSDLVFFTVIYALARKAEKRQRAESAAAMLDFSITSLSPEEWTRSLKTLTKPETTAKKAASSVPV